jgi:hypothetical protein
MGWNFNVKQGSGKVHLIKDGDTGREETSYEDFWGEGGSD